LTLSDRSRNDSRVDPITLVVTAVALGASAGLTDTATQAIKDAYTGLKNLLVNRSVDVSGVERRPDSATQRAALAETLTDTADIDEEALAAARAVTDAVAADDPDAGRVVGVSLRDLQAEFVELGTVTSTGDGVIVDGARLTGGFTAKEVRAGGTGGPDPSAR
jgi:hypothetical protein